MKKIRHHRITPTSILLLCIFVSGYADAAKYNGSVTLGGYASIENNQAMSDGTTLNDFAAASSRFFLKVDDITSNSYEFVTDIRDKNDFYGALDTIGKQLVNENSFQARQLSIRYPNPKGFYGTLGRFPVAEAGGVLNDGAEAGYHFSKNFGFAGFGGLNARLPEQTYATFNPTANQYGVYLNYEPKDQPWTSYLYSTQAYVTQSVASQIDRSYFYSNTVYQWAPDDRIFYLLYVDFVPFTFIQTASVSFQKKLGEGIYSEFGVLGYDTIEYHRLQSAREILTPSPYKEGNMRWKEKLSTTFQLTERASYGVRDLDHLSRFESALGINLPKLGDKHLDSYFEGGYRNRFDRYGPFAKVGTGYFSPTWELNLDLDYGIEYNAIQNKHVIVAEVAVGNFLSRELFSTFSFQYSADELVTIMSGFFKITYRFGRAEVSPIRDGASPVGRL